MNSVIPFLPFFKIRFNIIHPFSPHISYLKVFQLKLCLCMLSLSCVLHASPIYSFLFCWTVLKLWRWTQCNFLNPVTSLFVGFEVMKTCIFWDVSQCSLLKYNRRFGGVYRLHFRNLKAETFAWHVFSGWFPAWLTFRPWRWRRYVLPKPLLTINGLLGDIHQKT
jgi:hypothetical protein